MRISKVMLIVLVLCVVSALSISCGPESDSTTVAEEQVVAVQRGDLTVDITAVGNLAFACEEELTFGVEGTIEEVLAEVGDSMEEGQVLAKLDDTSIISLQKAVVQAKINLRDAESVKELDVAQAEAAVVDAKVALEAAQEALGEAEDPYTESDIAQAELAVINAEIALDRTQEDLERARERYVRNRTVPEWAQDYELKQKELAVTEFDLAEAEDDLAEMKAGADPLEVEQRQKQLALAQANLKEAEDDLAELLSSVDSLEVELRQSEVASAQAALDEAIERLEMVTMAAPFAGIVTSVDIEAGDAVNANQEVVELVDPDKFEADILVSEIDIFNIRLGAEATIQVDAMPGISLPAEVTFISPIATIQQGVVNYKVRVEIQSLEAVMQERQEAKQKVMPETIQLREGLTVTVSIIVEERDDVLLVPNGTIIRQGLETYVQVLEDGVIEQRSIITGISDWQCTEVIEGLSEGEKVVIPEATTPTTPEPKMPFFPGKR